MAKVVVFVEETSAKVLLESLLPRLLPEGVPFRVVPFEGKSDLEAQLSKRIKGWREPDTRFVVLRDQDSGNCHEVKSRLRTLCLAGGRSDALIRIACHELESWYLGDLVAVERGLEIRGLSRHSEVAKFRDPDRLNNAAQELRSLTKGEYQKVGGSRRIADHLDLSGANRSTSFRAFCDGVRRISAD